MNRRHVLLIGIGLPVSLLAAIAIGTIGNEVLIAGYAAVAGTDYSIVVAFFAIAMAVAAVTLVSGRERNLVQADVPDPERPVTMPPPGREFDRTVARRTVLPPVVGSDARDEIRERLRRAATETIARTEGIDRERAAARVDRGSWTDERRAAWFLERRERRTPPLGALLATWLAGKSWTRECIDRTIDELSRRAEASAGRQP